MHNDVDITFLPLNWEEEFSEKEKDLLASFDLFFSENRVKGFRKIKEGQYRLKVVDASNNYDKIFDYLKKIQANVAFTIYTHTKYENDDFDKAGAYLLRFEKKFEYYDEWNDEKYNSFQLICSSDHGYDCECKIWEHTDKIYVKPQSRLKRSFEQIAGATNYELSEDSIVSDAMFSYLTKNDVDTRFFRPVFQKKGERWAYLLDGRSSLIKSKMLKCNFYIGPEICPKCGRSIWHINEEAVNSFANAFREQVVIGNPNIFDCWTMDQKMIDKLKPVNITEDYFRANRLTVINKELFQLIQEKVPGITKNSIPIF